jgi:hypothetical protein
MWDAFSKLKGVLNTEPGSSATTGSTMALPWHQMWKVEDEEEPQSTMYNDNEVSGEEERGDTVDFIGYLPYLAEKDKEEGTMDHLPVMPYMVE